MPSEMPSSDEQAGSAPPPLSAAPPPPSAAHIWWSRRAMWLHAVLLVVEPAFAALFWWQVERVRHGNTLSWAYVFEWPFFAGYAVYLWWKLLHDQLDDVQPRAPSLGQTTGESAGAGGATDEDEELAAYNRYLAELNASGRRKRW